MNDKEQFTEELINDMHKHSTRNLPVYEEIGIAGGLVDDGWQKVSDDKILLSKALLEEFMNILYYDHLTESRFDQDFWKYYQEKIGVKLLNPKEFSKKYQ